MGTGKEPCARPSRPVPSTPLFSPLTVAKWFFRGVSIWLTLGAVLCDPRFGRSPSRTLSVPEPAGQGQPGMEERGGDLISHTRSVNPNLFGVPYSAPLSPLRVSPTASSPVQPQTGHFTSLLSVLIRWFTVWIAGLSVRRRFCQPCEAFLVSRGHRFLQGSV